VLPLTFEILVAIIVTLLPNRQQLQRLRLAIRDRHDIIECEDWAAAAHECDRAPVRVAVIDLFAEEQVNFEQIRRLRHRHPRLALIAYVMPGPDRVHDIFDAGRYGFESLIVAGRDDEPRRLLAMIEQAEARSLTGRLRAVLANADPVARDATLLALTRAHQRLSTVAFARLLARSRRSLAGLLEQHGFPPTQRLLMWGRLIVAGHLLEDTHRSADRVAESLGFPSGSAFRNACQRYVGMAPNEIRAAGGSTCVIEAFLRHVRIPGGVPHVPPAPRGTPVIATPALTPVIPTRAIPGPPSAGSPAIPPDAARPERPSASRRTPRDGPIWRPSRRLPR
jgi:AraC-like DNA-binding protein